VLDGIVSKALEKKPGRRYAGMSEMLEDIQELARQMQLTDDSRTATWRYAMARERNLKTIAAASAVAVVALLTVWGVGRMRAERPVPAGIPMQVTDQDGWEGEPAISPDGTRIAYVSLASGNADVYVTDILGGRTLKLTDHEGDDTSPTWFPDGATLAFVSDRSGTECVWTVGQFGGGVNMLVEDAIHPAVSPDGDRVAFSRVLDSGALRIFAAPVSDPSDAIALTGPDDGLWDHVASSWSPDGRMIGYSATRDIWAVPADGGEPIRLTSDNTADAAPVWSPDGEYVYFDSWREGTLALWRVRAGGGTPVRMTQGTGYEAEPTVSKDGSRLAYSAGSTGSGAIIMDIETGQQTVIGRMRTQLYASLSPDGRKMVFVSQRWDRRHELAEQTLDGGLPTGPPRRLTNQEGVATHPAYSPDGRWVAYYLISDEERDIWTVPSGGGIPIRFTDDPAQDVHPAWSPDGSMLVFTSERSGGHDLWVAPVNEGRPTGEPRRITDGTVAALSPSWSPDGPEVPFLGSTGGTWEVWVVASDGRSPPRQLTHDLSVMRVRWDQVGGSILASGTGASETRQLWSVSPETGEVTLFEPRVDFGTKLSVGLFDLAAEARLIAFSRENLVGDIWVSDGPPGSY
jgi:TolB protein